MRHASTLVPVALVAILLTAGFATLRHYGVNWDEALGDMFFGQRYASFFASFDGKYLDFDRDPYPAGHRPDFSMSPFRRLPYQYWPLANTLAYATSVVFWPVLDPYDGFHAFNLVLAAAFLIVLYRFVQSRISTAAALAATLLLFTSPRVVYDLMVNVKDFPEMVFFSLAAMTFFAAWERRSVPGLLGAGALWGCALATKANAAFFPLIVILYIATDRKTLDRRLAAGLMGAGAAGVLVMFASWPWLWSDPIGNLRVNLSYVTERTMQTSGSVTSSPLAMVLFTTQPLFLLLAVAGIVRASRLAWRGDRLQRFLLIWSGVIVARIAIPGAANFDGVRHFLELFPPLAILAGVAVQALPRWRVAAAVCAALPGIAGVVTLHPYQNVYWNALIGGTAGAQARRIPQSGEYWGTSYRQGMEWLNRNAPPNSALVVPIGEQIVGLVESERLRDDIQILAYSPGRIPEEALLGWVISRTRQQPVFVMFILREEFGNRLTATVESSLRPVAEWSRAGVPLMRIYRLPESRDQ